MLRSLFLVSCTMLASACPGSPRFEAHDTDEAADAEPDVAPETFTETSEETVADTHEDAEVHAPTGTPCERDCAVQIASELTVSIAALVDHAGRATVALVESDDGGGTGVLRVRRYVPVGDWDVQDIAAGFELAGDVALAEEPPGQLHVLLEQGDDTPSATLWFHPTTEPGWARKVLLDVPRCERPLFRRGDALFASCIAIDARELRILELVGSTPETFTWTPRFARDELGWVEGTVRILTTRWALDAADHPHIATRCCESEDPKLYHHGWDGETWTATDLGTTVGSYPQTDIAIDALGRPHVLFVEYVPSMTISRLVDRYFDDNAWKRVIVDEATVAGSTLGQALRLEAASDGSLHVIYRDRDELAYRTWTGGPTWSARAVAPVVVDASVQATLTVQGTRPHVVLTDPADHPWWWIPVNP